MPTIWCAAAADVDHAGVERRDASGVGEAAQGRVRSYGSARMRPLLVARHHVREFQLNGGRACVNHAARPRGGELDVAAGSPGAEAAPGALQQGAGRFLVLVRRQKDASAGSIDLQQPAFKGDASELRADGHPVLHDVFEDARDLPRIARQNAAFSRVEAQTL